MVFKFLFSSVTNRLIPAKDHSSVQINVAEVTPEGVMIHGQYKQYVISGAVRKAGQSDDAFSRLAQNDGYL